MNNSMNIEIVRLHEHRELLHDVVKILNLEWPRSETARIRSLNDSKDDLPCSLLLVNKCTDGTLDVIGHSKLSNVHGKLKSVFIENVIIVKRKRGCGLGRKLMELSELHVSKLGYQDVYLSTHDKCKFYEYLGYAYCSSVSPVRANAKLLTPEQFSALQTHFGEQNEQDSKENKESKTQQGKIKNEDNLQLEQQSKSEEFDEEEKHKPMEDCNILEKLNAKSICQSQQTPPIPTPPPPPFLEKSLSSNESEKQFWMIKHL